MQQLNFDFEKPKKPAKPAKKEQAEKKAGSIEDVRGSVKNKALAVAAKELVGKEKFDLDNPEDAKKAMNKVSEYLSKTWVQKAVNTSVEKIDTMSAMESIRNKWNKLSPGEQFACIYAPYAVSITVPVALTFSFLVKTGLLTYKKAPTRADMEESGKIVRPAVKGAVEIGSWFYDDFKAIKPFVEPFLQVVESLDSVMYNANDHLQKARKNRGNMN